MVDHSRLKLFYHVMGRDGGPSNVIIDRSETVLDLKKEIALQICKEAADEDAPRLHRLIKLYQVQFLNNDEPEQEASGVIEKLKLKAEVEDKNPCLISTLLLSDYWPEKPVDRMIHVVVELPDESERRSAKRARFEDGPPMKPISPSLSSEEINGALLVAYKPFQSNVQEFAQRDQDGSEHMLFNDLGNVVTANLREAVFKRYITTIVYNVSGAGKTRTLLDGLCHNWGLYYALRVKDSVGSSDISSAELALPDFSKWRGSGSGQEGNYLVATRWLATLLCARLFVLLEFLKLTPSASTAALARTRWTLLQCSPPMRSKFDLFNTIAKSIRAAAEDDVNEKIVALCCELGSYPTYFPGWDAKYPLRSLNLFLVLDEAQVGIETLPNSFQSETSLARRPFLYAFFRYFQDRGDVTGIILSGTAFSFRDLVSAVGSQVAQRLGISTIDMEMVSEVGRFSGDLHLQYVQNHLHWITTSQTHNRLKERIQYWFPGRHRLAAGLVQIMRLTGGQASPHRMLTLYVRSMTGGFRLTDAEELEANEPVLNDHVMGDIITSGRLLPVTLEKTGKEVYDALVDVFMRWSIGSELTLVGPQADVQSLISLGVGYLANAPDPTKDASEDLEYVVANKPVHFVEPLMILRISKLLGVQGRKDWMTAQLRRFMEKSDLGFRFEQAMMMTLMDSFNAGYTKLDKIFHIGEGSAELKVRLVSLNRFSHGELAAVPVTWTTGCKDRWGFKAQNPSESLKWFTEPSGIPFLLPDTIMGPDLFFFGQDEASNELIAFGMQCRIRPKMPPAEWSSAQSTLAWENFYKIKRGDEKVDYAHKSNPNLNGRVISALDKLLDHEYSTPTANTRRSLRRKAKTKVRKTVKYIALVAPTNEDTFGDNVPLTQSSGVVRTSLFKDFLGSTSSVLTEPKAPAILS